MKSATKNVKTNVPRYDLMIYPYSFFNNKIFIAKIMTLFEINKHLGVSRYTEKFRKVAHVTGYLHKTV